MHTYIDNHLQQRKSSLSSLTRTKRESSSRAAFQSIKNQENGLNKQQSQQCLKSEQKSIMKSHNNDNINAIRLQDQQQLSCIKKVNPSQPACRLRDQQSSDYIRNLYKKYLGKQNKQPAVDRLNAFTQRKLKTTQSKQIIVTNNTTGKDFTTRRALFADGQNVQTVNTSHMRKQGNKVQQGQSNINIPSLLMKKEKTKISHIVSQQSESYETPYQQKSTNNDNCNKSTAFQSNKKDITKKQDKQNCYQKQCESKKSNKNYKSKSKMDKAQQSQQQAKSATVLLKRSQSTHVKSQKTNFTAVIEDNNRRSVNKQKGMEVSLSKGQGNKITKDSKCEQNGYVHPHRESYCQFDTQQQIKNKDSQCQSQNEHNFTNKNHQPLNERRQSTAAESRSFQNLNQYQPSLSHGDIYLRYINDLSTLQLITGKQNSLFQALQKINIIKSKKSTQSTMMTKYPSSKLYEQKQIIFEQRLVNHRLIL